MLLVDLWIVVMVLSGPERSTVRTAQLTGKHPTGTNPERVDLNGAIQSSRSSIRLTTSPCRNRYFKVTANYLAVIQLAGDPAKVADK